MSARARNEIRIVLLWGVAVTAALWGKPGQAEEFSLQDAEAQVQTVVEAPQRSTGTEGTSGTLGLDAHGRVVLAKEGSRVIGYRLSSEGKILEQVDESGNRASYVYDEKGFATEVRIQPAGHAASVGHFVRDQGGKIFAKATERVGASELPARLQALGAEPWSDEYELPASPGELSSRIVDSSFAQRILQRPAEGSPPVPDGVVATQTTTGPAWSGGGADAPQLSMTLTQREVPEGYLLEDDWGGWQLLTYDEVGHLGTVSDADGFVARFSRDEKYHRLTDVALGDDFILHYVYDEDGEWSKKQVVEADAGEVVFEAVRAAGQGKPGTIQKGSVLPRLTSHIELGDSGRIVEWDEQICPNGCLVATFKTEPYALIPLQSPPTTGDEQVEPTSPAVLYSLPLSEGERLDYSTKTIWLHLEVERAGVTGFEPTTVLVELARSASSGKLAASPSAKQSHAPRGQRGKPFFNKGCRVGGKFYTCRTIAGVYTCYIEATSCNPPPTAYIPPLFPPPMTPVNPRPRGPQERNRDRGDALKQQDERTVTRAKQLARAKLTMQTCALLFSKPTYAWHDPFAIIDTSTYWNGTSVLASGSRPCATAGRPAWTFPNSRQVELCFPAFNNRSEREQAVVIIHEALHSAGQAEVDSPSDPLHLRDPIRYPTPEEISAWVRDACDLR